MNAVDLLGTVTKNKGGLPLMFQEPLLRLTDLLCLEVPMQSKRSRVMEVTGALLTTFHAARSTCRVKSIGHAASFLSVAGLAPQVHGEEELLNALISIATAAGHLFKATVLCKLGGCPPLATYYVGQLYEAALALEEKEPT